MNGVLSLLELPDRDDTVRTLLLLLPPLLPLDLDTLDFDEADTLDLDERLDLLSDPDLDPVDPVERLLRPVLDDRPDLAVRPDLVASPVFEERSDTSERLDLDDSSEMEDSLVLEVTSDTVDRAVVDLFCSGSG